MDPLSQDQLAAFAAVVRTGSFTAAARALHLTQPALSRRIAGLELRLATALVVRGPRQLTLTDAGQRLLGFVQAQRALEDELLAELAPSGDAHRGTIRIAGLSSVVPDVIVPALAPFLHAHPGVQLELRHVDDDDRAATVARGAADFAVSYDEPAHASLVRVAVGVEEYVVIERARGPARPDVFLDTSPADRATEWFFGNQPARARPRRWQRSFLDDEAGILLGVACGLGRAVKARHTIPTGAPVRIDPRFATVTRPVFLYHRPQRYYGRLHTEVAALLERELRARLRPRAT
ncbi:MAG: LysR family transcriptional regulator [Myxococcales bacterium]|nr:LysR family transcriptional regulator [Myxococcales bacterium]